ncbi:uncharacterized protein LOC118435268 [Folsomia candida]|uniref:Zinc finger Y-chromosomal protein 2 n=1 Tax=Folsomia candida TaxID=158441 RepID=A0A226EFL7_FOLCA|nr:uncharacterized protein LOC118435268 [Folsomia candida]OXA56375.1 Zinc finger Y-chromosomal protein 2 [Folsomia candida]
MSPRRRNGKEKDNNQLDGQENKPPREKIPIRVEKIIIGRGGVKRLLKVEYKRNSKPSRHVTIIDVQENDYIYCIDKDTVSGNNEARRMTREELATKDCNSFQLFYIFIIFWRDVKGRIRDYVFGITRVADLDLASQNAIVKMHEKLNGCSIVDDTDPTYTIVKEDVYKLPIFACSKFEIQQLKQCRRREDGLAGSFMPADSITLLENISADLKAIIDPVLERHIIKVDEEPVKFEDLEVTITSKDVPPPTPKKHQCNEPDCNFSAAKSYDLKVHVEAIHLKLQKYKCQYCDARFTRDSSRKYHETSQHTDRKQPVIPFADISKARSANVQPPTPTRTSSTVTRPITLFPGFSVKRSPHVPTPESSQTPLQTEKVEVTESSFEDIKHSLEIAHSQIETLEGQLSTEKASSTAKESI